MTNFKRFIMWVVLIMILILILFSVYGAFIGTSRAADFFNTLPLAIYWITFIALLALGIGIFKKPNQFPTSPRLFLRGPAPA